MKNLIVLLAVAFMLAACGSVKHTQTKDLAVHNEVVTHVDSSKKVTSETKTFGDTLTGNSYIPVSPDSVTSKGDFTFQMESKGISVVIKNTPVYSSTGKITGLKQDVKAIAKPTTITNTAVAEQANVHIAAKQDSVAHTTDKTITKAWSLPWWGYGLLGIALLYGLFRLAKYLKII